MESLANEIRYAFRSLRKNPVFTVVAVVTIALGIGANTAIFSVVRAVLLRPLPYEDPGRLVLVWGRMTERNVENFPTSPPVLRELRERAGAFDDLAGVVTFQQALTGGSGDPEQIQAGGVTANFTEVLGVRPVLGRGFREEDAVFTEPQPGFAGAGPPRATLLSWELWQRRFGGEADAIGKSVEIGGNSVEIVGIMPRGFELLLPAGSGVAAHVDAWLVAPIDYDNWPWANVIFNVVGRLAQGVSLERAQADLDQMAAFVRQRERIFDSSGFEMEVVPMRDELTEDVRPTILALLGAVGFVLLIACANVSNLLLVRASSREREMAIRGALGGGRWRITRQLLVESIALGLTGGLLGVAVAWVGIETLLALRPAELPRIDQVSIDAVVLAFTLVVTMAAALLFGLWPAFQAAKVDMVDSLKERAGGSGLSRQRMFRNGVVIAEVALSVVLLIGAGLLVRSFIQLHRQDPGFDPRNVLTFNLSIPLTRYPTTLERSNFALEVRRLLESLPGVRSASAGLPVPLAGAGPFNGRYGTEEALTDDSRFRQADYRVVLPDYFETLGTRVLAGRTFTPADFADSASVVVIDELLARRTWPGESPVGKRFLVRLTSTEPEWVEVIGVVEHQRAENLAEDGREAIFFTDRWAGAFGNHTWVVKSDLPPQRLVPQVRTVIGELDPDLPISDVATMEDHLSTAMASTRFALALIGVFAVIALALAAVGLYGVLAYVVRQRTREIGVRMAFGAEAGDILRTVVGHGMQLTVAGLALGLAAAFWLTRLMASLLVEVGPTDPVTFVAIAALFVAVAVVAAGGPALWASRLDPATALREE